MTTTPRALRIGDQKLSGRVDSLAFDPFRGALWYLTTSQSGAATLHEVSAADGAALAQYSVPAGAGDGGVATTVAVAPDQSIWVAGGYGIVRVEPATGAVQGVKLPVTVPGSLPAASDPDAALPGTWVTSLTFTATSAIVGRQNVPFLQQYSLDLHQSASIALPAGDDAPAALTIDGSQIEVFIRSKISAIEWAHVSLPEGFSAPHTPQGEPVDPSSVAARVGTEIGLISTLGEQVLVADIGSGTLTWQPHPGESLTLPWPAVTGQVANPLGHLVPVTSRPQVTAAAQTPDGTLWVAMGGGSTWELDGYTAQG